MTSPSRYPITVRARSVFAAVLLYGLLALGVALTLLPLLWMLAASLMPPGEANSYPPRLWPSAITFEHYAAPVSYTHLDVYKRQVSHYVCYRPFRKVRAR